MDMRDIEQFQQKLIEVRKTSSDLSFAHWLREELWTWGWWLSVALTILPWFVWWKFVDKKRTFEILTYGLFITMMATFLDVVGSELVLWNYPTRILPIVPAMLPFDFTIAPIIFMLLYQYFPKWKSYLIAGVVISATLAFVAEPLLVKMNLYVLITWQYIYSFPIYLGAAIFAKWLVGNIKKATMR
ncbi:MAG: hypothetical protein H7Y41_01645 [Hyphomonadaceae bacterium]|nr:hypothetical protein [Clostridia bacterium]